MVFGAGKTGQKKKTKTRNKTQTKPKPTNNHSKWLLLLFWILLCRWGVQILVARRPLLRASNKNHDRKREKRDPTRQTNVRDIPCSGLLLPPLLPNRRRRRQPGKTGSSRSSGQSSRNEANAQQAASSSSCRPRAVVVGDKPENLG